MRLFKTTNKAESPVQVGNNVNTPNANTPNVKTSTVGTLAGREVQQVGGALQQAQNSKYIKVAIAGAAILLAAGAAYGLNNDFKNVCQGTVGNMTLDDGSFFEGCLVDEKPEGHGRSVSNVSGIYEGAWHLGKKLGFGVLTRKDYNLSGFWNETSLKTISQGETVVTWPNGGVFRGNLTKLVEAEEATATMTWQDGSVYRGSFTNLQNYPEQNKVPQAVDVVGGPGKFTSKNGPGFETKWQNNQLKSVKIHFNDDWKDARLTFWTAGIVMSCLSIRYSSDMHISHKPLIAASILGLGLAYDVALPAYINYKLGAYS